MGDVADEVYVNDPAEQIEVLNDWLKSLVADASRHASVAAVDLVLYDVYACQPEGKPHAIRRERLTFERESKICAWRPPADFASNLVEVAMDYALGHGAGSYTFEVYVQGSDDEGSELRAFHRFTLEVDLCDDEEDFNDVVEEVLSKRSLWLRFATAALAGTATNDAVGSETIAGHACDVADDMVKCFHERWPEDISDVPDPANDEPVTTLDEFEAKWGPCGERLQKLVQEFVRCAPDFPADYAFAKRVGLAMADLESALRYRKDQP